MKKVSVVFTLSILFLGMIMRAPFTTIPTVLPEIAQTFHMQIGALGILTTIPLLIFAGLSSFAGKIMQRFGLERVLLAAILFIFIGSISRIAGYGPMLVGTVLIGLGITFINVLLPATLIKYVPAQIGQYTGLYSTTMTVSTALFQMIAVPIVAIASWQVLIVILSIVVGLAGIIWLLNMREVAAAAHAIQTPQFTPEFAKVKVQDVPVEPSKLKEPVAAPENDTCRDVCSLVALTALAVLSSLLSCNNLACFADTGLVASLVVKLSTTSDLGIKSASIISLIFEVNVLNSQLNHCLAGFLVIGKPSVKTRSSTSFCPSLANSESLSIVILFLNN